MSRVRSPENLCSPSLLYCNHGMCNLIKDPFVLLLHDVSKADLLLSFLSPSFLRPAERVQIRRRAARCSAGNDCSAADGTRPVSEARRTRELQEGAREHSFLASRIFSKHCLVRFPQRGRAEPMFSVFLSSHYLRLYFLNREQLKCPVPFCWC